MGNVLGWGWAGESVQLYGYEELQVALAGWFYLQSVRCPPSAFLVSMMSQACLQDRHMASGNLKPFHHKVASPGTSPDPSTHATPLETHSQTQQPPAAYRSTLPQWYSAPGLHPQTSPQSRWWSKARASLPRLVRSQTSWG